MSDAYMRKSIEKNASRYQESANLRVTRKGGGTYVLPDNNLWSILAQKPNQVPNFSHKYARRTKQHLFEEEVRKKRRSQKSKTNHNLHRSELWALSDIKWDPLPGFQNEADKRPKLGGRSRVEFEQSLKVQEEQRFKNLQQLQSQRRKAEEKFKSSLPISWEIGSSWNPAENAKERFCTNYQSMQRVKEETRNSKTVRKSAARLQSSSIKFG